MAESSKKNMKLLIISKFPYGQWSAAPLWCYLGMDESEDRIYRPIPPQSGTPNERDFFWHDDFQVGETHEFKIAPSIAQSELPLPHGNDDIQVTHKRRIKDAGVVDMVGMYKMLKKNASKTIEKALDFEGVIPESNNGREYVEEDEDCSSVGIYKCTSLCASLLAFHENGHELPDDKDQEVLVIIELGRPFYGRNEFDPRRCFLIEAGVVFNSAK